MATFTLRARLCAAALSVLSLPGCTKPAVRTPDGLVGEPLQTAVDRLGAPSSDVRLTVRKGDALPEMQSGLYPAVLDTLADGASAVVREVRWTGDPAQAMWAVERGGTWVVVDAVAWDADVEF